ncbi:MAG: hypothetical protein JXA23_05420, partial [Bacteroidales bacterium]|nr:hypothetical protein [Bacteroidales bacterium]
MKLRQLRVLFLLLSSLTAFSGEKPGGSLIITGGGLEPDNREIFGELIRRAGGAGRATFAVIPAASGVPVQSYSYFRSELVSYGIHPDRIHLI